MHINDILSRPDLQAIIARFETMYRRGEPDECWEWQRALSHNGYGLFTLWHHQQVRAHRFSYVVYNGPIPEGRASNKSNAALVMRHRCHNPLCVNPKHLRPGTTAQNTKDAIEVGHFRVAGEDNQGAKLTIEQVKAIRLDTRHDVDVAIEYGLSRGSVRKIKNGQSWKSVRSPIVEQPKWLSGAEGEYNGRAKLTEVDVLSILQDPRPYPVIASEYGIHRESVGNIKRRITWTHLLGAK